MSTKKKTPEEKKAIKAKTPKAKTNQVAIVRDELKELGKELNENQLLFANLYGIYGSETFGNRVRSYAEAYNIDIMNPKSYKVAMVNSSRLLSNAKIMAYVRELRKGLELNAEMLDQELSSVVHQDDDLKSKVAAIKEANRVLGRGTENHSLVDGEGKSIFGASELTIKVVRGKELK